MRTILVIFFLFACTQLAATTHQVGPTKMYLTPNALYQAGVVQQGDTITIDAAIYSGTATLAVWQPDNLVIKGIGGRPHLQANGAYIYGKGIWVFAGNDITVENIEFSGASVPDKNGAGIRLDGIGITVRNCYFHHNENGILTSNPQAGDLLIEYTEFAYNGYGDGYTHNLYVGRVNSLTFRYNYSHHTMIGHNLKSRARNNYILYNRIMDEQTGNSSRLIDLPNGGPALVMGNLLMQGNNAPNNNLLGYGKEGLSNPAPHELYVINNTFLNKRQASCRFLDIQNGTTATAINNIFTGTGTVFSGPITNQSNNLVEPVISNLNFIDEPNYDYRIAGNSPAKDMGTTVPPMNGFQLTPDKVYVHPVNQEMRPLINGTIDVGAYEYNACLNLDVKVYLEGAYDSSTGLMQTDLHTKKLLPNMTNNQQVNSQPYIDAPWNYYGNEGVGWTDADYPTNTVDWVLISFRTGLDKASEVFRIAGLLLADGTVYLPQGCPNSMPGNTFYITIEHRNHLIVMTPNPVMIMNRTLSWDFTTSNSYASGGTGQREVVPGVWAMLAGDSDQLSDTFGYDINGIDLIYWQQRNGLFNKYSKADCNFDGDISGADKALLQGNNGSFSGVQK